ncbi:hypothetical protein L484_022609 [Morus notabilis]|uniref:C2 NT-type domain-containing protein n=1 Tax=Morus notabilis TaxID=981085 RepID=W9R8C3_9ROSA|nr:hypothetical protein L484_022609 [Morus notabilis]
MLRLHRHRQAAKSGDKLDFKFSSFKALQVPKGWDKLVVSVVSVETGKTIAKTSKAAVHNGNCQWSETLSESIRVSQDGSSKEMEDCPFKLIVFMGSARSGILGDATVNMTDYMSTSASVPVSLDEDSKERNYDLEKPNGNSHDIDTKSDGSVSDSTVARSLGSSAAKDFRLISNPGEPGSRETSFSLSESHKSYDTEGSEDVSVGDHSGDVHSLVRRADSIGSENSVTLSKPASFNSQMNISENSRQEFPASSLTTTSSAKNFRDTAEGTIEELRAEAKMWERNARKLMLDLDILRGEFSDQSKVQENLNLELLAAYDERDDLKKEVEQLRFSLEKSMVKQTSSGNLTSLGEDLPLIEKELKDELKFQKESNANLALQLKKTQESNIELVSVLQELEETIDKQKTEIEDLLALQSKVGDMGEITDVNVEENKRLTDQIQKMQEVEKNLNIEVKQLEQALEEKNQEIEKAESLNSQTLLDLETEFKSKLLDKEEQIVNLKAKLLGSLSITYSAEMGSTNGSDVNLMNEIEELKEKVQELERDCNELTEENLELLFKLKESKKGAMRSNAHFESPHSEVSTNTLTSFEFQLSGQKFRTNDAELSVKANDDNASVQRLQSLKMEPEARLAEMDNDLPEKRSEVEKLHIDLLSKEEEISVLRKSQSELEAKVSDLQRDKTQLQEHMEVVLQESEITSKCLNDLRNDLAVLTSSMDPHISANKLLERKSSELETGNRELELHVSELEGENAKLSELVASLEDELRCLTSEQESSQLELEKSKSHSMTLQDEINRLRIEMASEKETAKQKLENMEDQLLEVQEECEYLRRANPKLQSTVESLLEECNSLQKSKEELSNEKLELHNRCSLLEAKLEESHLSFTDCSKRVDELEQCLSSVLAEFASKEKCFASEIVALVDENLRHKEKFNQEENLLNQMYMEKAVEVENLQQEVELLINKLSAKHEENERISSDAMEELSRLRADNTKLDADLQQARSKIKKTEDELRIKQKDYEVKLKSLSSELAASNQDHEKLSKLSENYKSGEAKLKSVVNDLEIRLRALESERRELVEESAHLKVQLQKLAHLEAEILAFKNELDETKIEKEKLEVSVLARSNECEDLKAEKNELVENVSFLKMSVSELEDCKSEKMALEERDAELKKELNQIRRENNQYQQKIQQLQEERDKRQRRSPALEEELKLVKEERHHNPREYSGRKSPNFSKTNTKVNPVHETSKISKNEMAKSGREHRDTRRNGMVQEVGRDSHRTQSQRENGSGYEFPDGSPRENGADTGSKIQLLEDQLAKALEENNKYKVQLNKLVSEGRKGLVADASRKSRLEGEVVSKEKYEMTKSSLEAELRDILERYSNMSLKYAQAEAQREELVMKLKTTKTGKRWFS